MPSRASSVTHWLATCSPRMSAAPGNSCGRQLICVHQLLDQGLHRGRAELQLADQCRTWNRARKLRPPDRRGQCARRWRNRIGRHASGADAPRRAPASISTEWRCGQQAVATEVRPNRAIDDAMVKSQASIKPIRRPLRPPWDARDRRLGEIVDRPALRPSRHRGTCARNGVELGPAQHPVEVRPLREGRASPHDITRTRLVGANASTASRIVRAVSGRRNSSPRAGSTAGSRRRLR